MAGAYFEPTIPPVFVGVGVAKSGVAELGAYLETPMPLDLNGPSVRFSTAGDATLVER